MPLTRTLLLLPHTKRLVRLESLIIVVNHTESWPVGECAQSAVADSRGLRPAWPIAKPPRAAATTSAPPAHAVCRPLLACGTPVRGRPRLLPDLAGGFTYRAGLGQFAMELSRKSERRILVSLGTLCLILLGVIVVHMHQDVAYYEVRGVSCSVLLCYRYSPDLLGHTASRGDH